MGTLRAVLGVGRRQAGCLGGHFNFEEFGHMRKFLMVAAVVAVAACGKKQGDTGSMEAAGAAAGAAVDSVATAATNAMGAVTDSAKAAVGTMADSAHAAMGAIADSTKAAASQAVDAAKNKMEAKPTN
jgi:hypothetical protein